MHITVFEYGYLTFDKAASQELGAKLISVSAFAYLKEVCLGESDTGTRQCLGLTKRYGYELLQVKNYVGVIMTPSGEHIEVLPKIGRKAFNSKQAVVESREMLLMMLQHLQSFRYLSSHQAQVASKSMPLLEVFISQFLQSVNRLVKRGLKSDYVPRVDNLNYQKGKLLVSQQIRHNVVNKHKFYVAYENYLTDKPANRIIKTALDRLTSITRYAPTKSCCKNLSLPLPKYLVVHRSRWISMR